MQFDIKTITAPLTDALQPHIERVNDAGAYLMNNTPAGPRIIEASFEGLAAAVVLCHLLATHSGWWKKADGTPIDPNDPYVVGTKMALIHSEVSEALEGARKGHNDSHLPERKAIEVELADAVIRIFDTAGAMKLDLAGAVVEKLAYNQQRVDHKLEARAEQGGKTF